VAHLLRATFRFLLPDLRGRTSKALVAIKLAALLGLVLTLAALPRAAGEGWQAGLIALDGILLFAGFLVSLAVWTPAAQDEGRVVVVTEGQVIPANGEIIGGVAVIDEAAITGVSGGVVREAKSDRSVVLAGTLVVSGRILVRTATGRRRGSRIAQMVARPP
jgi:K+-transporting ATPase ATPase B chain